MAPKAKLGDDVAFGITSGYYPQIASRINYKERPGIHGSTGAKWAQVRGFTKSSIAKHEMYTYSDQGEPRKTASGKPGKSETWREKLARHRQLYNSDENVKKTPGLPERDQYVKRQDRPEYVGKGEDRKKTGKMLEAYKWVGGSTEFRIYGDQIWYMHGVRTKGSNILMEYVGGFNVQPAFQKIYSASEPKLIKKAVEMADRVFGRALDKVAIKRFGEAASESAAAEEIGFKSGDFEYMSYKQALKAKDSEGNLKYAHLLDKVAKSSYANERDMVKIIHTEAGPVIDKVLDVTEMPIGEGPAIAKHGIVDIPEALTDAIDAAINMNDPEGDMESLRMAVEIMFMKNIKDDYNPLIQDMKETANEHREKAGKGEVTTFEQILKTVKKGKGKVSKDAIKSGLGLKLGATARSAEMPKVYSESAFDYVVHMLATWGDKVSNDYTQAHRVFDYPEGSPAPGQSVYAFTTMRQYKSGAKVLEFRPNAPKGPKNTFILTGYSATLALEYNRSDRQQKQAQVRALTNKRTLMHQRVTNYGTNQHRKQRGQSTISAGSKPLWSTQVFTAPNKSMNVMLQRMLDAVIGEEEDAYAKELRGMMATELSDSVYSLGSKKRAANAVTLQRGRADFNEPMFWALPYIGVLQSEHIEREAKK